jgi:hypothetical protein
MATPQRELTHRDETSPSTTPGASDYLCVFALEAGTAS